MTPSDRGAKETSSLLGSGIAPLERFVAPAGLTGEDGDRRWYPRAECRTTAKNDCEAICAWLAEVPVSDGAYLSLRNSAERLLNWACYERRVAVSSLNREDLQAFMAFLNAPYPSDRWICPRSTRRDSSEWRPFYGALKTSSQRTVMKAIASLSDWMTDKRYATLYFASDLRNLRYGYGRQSLCATECRRSKSGPLSPEAWRWVELRLGADANPPTLATRLVLELLYFAGMKHVDVCKLREAHCLPPTPNFVAWRLYLASRPGDNPWVYALPPLAKSLWEWFGALASTLRPERIATSRSDWESELVFSNSATLIQRVHDLLRQAGRMAEAGGDRPAARELRLATPFNLRHAIELHHAIDTGSNDGLAFSKGIVAHPRLKGETIMLYVDRIPVTRRSIQQWMGSLGHLWATYPENLPDFRDGLDGGDGGHRYARSERPTSDTQAIALQSKGTWHLVPLDYGAAFDAYRSMDRYIRKHVVPGTNERIADWIFNAHPGRIASSIRDHSRAWLAWAYVLWAFTLEPTIRRRRWRDPHEFWVWRPGPVQLKVPLFLRAWTEQLDVEPLQQLAAPALLDVWHLAAFASRAATLSGYVYWGPGAIRPDLAPKGGDVALADRLSPAPRRSKDQRTFEYAQADRLRRERLALACRGRCLTYESAGWSVLDACSEGASAAGCELEVARLLGVVGRPRVAIFQGPQHWVARLLATPLQVKAGSPRECFSMLREACDRYASKYGAPWVSTNLAAKVPRPIEPLDVEIFRHQVRDMVRLNRFWKTGPAISRVWNAYQASRMSRTVELGMVVTAIEPRP